MTKDNVVLHGDCLDRSRELEDNSVESAEYIEIIEARTGDEAK